MSYSVLLPGEDVEDTSHVSHRYFWPVEPFGEFAKGKREIGVICTESNDGCRGKICDSCPYGIFSKIL